VPTQPISIIVGITGFIRGQVVYAIDSNFAYSVAHAMLPNRLPVDIKKVVNSAISEIANIITGQASIALAGGSGKIDLTPPVVLMASDLTIDFVDMPTISLSLISEIGVLEINIALADEEKAGQHA
jgi:chemotaxis protein CheX